MNNNQASEIVSTDNYYMNLKDVIQNSYYIASYQRGYRWDTSNIRELLDDIFEGKLTEGNIPKETKESDPYDLIFAIKNAIKQNGESKYCLQPLVVKKKEDHKYSVIDGQQRLTTLFVILKAFSRISDKPFPKNFSLSYQSRKKSKDFLDNLDDNATANNIDAAYILQAFQFAKDWFLKKNKEFTDHIDSYSSNEPGSMHPALASHMYAVLTEQTRFIWDEVNESSTENEQKIFADRNTGKLDLTDSELIKSLFMNPEYYGDQKNDIRDRQTLISEIWDIYENELHKSDFWAFIPLSDEFKENYASKTRIDAVFHLLTIKEKETIRTEEHGLFKAVQKWIFKKRADALENAEVSITDTGKGTGVSNTNFDPMAQVMHQCWRDVCDLSDGILELYENNELYNLLSLFKIIVNNDTDSVFQLYLEVLNSSKNKRPGIIKSKIKDILFQGDISACVKKTKYPSPEIRNILIAHNIAIINTNNPIERFPFKFFESGHADEYKWEREHIYASNEAYIENADLDEQISVLKLFSFGDSYKKYVNYLHDRDIDAEEKSFVPSATYSDFASMCFDKSQRKYDFYFDTWRYLMLKKNSTDLLRRIDIKAEIDEILQEKDPVKQKRRLEDFFQNTDYDDGKMFIFLGADYLFWDENIRSEFLKIKESGNTPSAIRWHDHDVDIHDPFTFWNSDPEDQDNQTNFRRNYYRKLLDEIYDNTGIPSNYVTLENHGPRKKVIVNDNNMELLLSFVKGTNCRINEKVRQFFKKGEHINAADYNKGESAGYTTFADFINDNTMGNMMLLPKVVNNDGIYRSANFDGKRKRVSEMKKIFLPIASTNVLLGKYNTLGSAVRQWLMEERIQYLEDMIKTMKEYFE